MTTATRLAEHADPGRVVMNPATWTMIEDRCCGRTLNPVKMEGEVELVECLAVP